MRSHRPGEAHDDLGWSVAGERSTGPTKGTNIGQETYGSGLTPATSIIIPVSLLTFCGLRISEALNADIRDYGHDHGHRVLKITRKGGKTARVALAPPVVRALDDYVDGRSAGRIIVGRDGEGAYGYRLAYAQLGRLCRDAGLPAGVTPHSLRPSYATESLRLGAALQDVQDALGHADPRTTRRYDRSRNRLDKDPTYTLAAAMGRQ